MGLDDELESMEDGFETDAEAAEEELNSEIEDEYEDTELGPGADEENMEDAYVDFDENEIFEDEEILDDPERVDEDDVLDEVLVEVFDEDELEDDLAEDEEDLDEEEYGEGEYDDEEEEELEEAADEILEEDDEFDLGITKERVAEATNDFNDIYREGAAAAKELKEAYDDIRSAFDFGGLFGKK